LIVNITKSIVGALPHMDFKVLSAEKFILETLELGKPNIDFTQKDKAIINIKFTGVSVAL